MLNQMLSIYLVFSFFHLYCLIFECKNQQTLISIKANRILSFWQHEAFAFSTPSSTFSIANDTVLMYKNNENVNQQVNEKQRLK